jgi:hypothetical protein
MGLTLNGTHQLLMYADDIQQLRDYVDTMKEYVGVSSTVKLKVKVKLSP